MTDEKEPSGSRVYAEIRGYELSEFQAWLIQRSLTVILILVFLFHLAPLMYQDYQKKVALEEDLQEMGCEAIFKNRGNFSIEGQKSEEELLNIQNQSRIPFPGENGTD